MLMLLFSVEDERYAIESNQILKVLPLSKLNKPSQAPKHVAGLLNYQGKVVPIVDLCQLLRGTPCKLHLSTRIILVNFLQGETLRMLGILAERVTQTIHQEHTQVLGAEAIADTSPYLGNLITDTEGMIRYLKVESLLSTSGEHLPELQQST